MFGDKLKKLRTSNGISQEELGKVCYVSKATVSNWENNITQPPVESIIKIAKSFNVSTDYLLDYTQEDKNDIEKLKIALREAGMLNGDDGDMTKEDFEKAMAIVRTLKERENKEN